MTCLVSSSSSPYFQKIFIDNPCKHPIIVLKDVRGWEVQCIVDFMYKGETSVPETQLTSLIKAAEGLKVRGLTSADHGNVVQRPMDPSEFTRTRYHRSPSPYRHGDASPPHPKLAGISSTSGPVSCSYCQIQFSLMLPPYRVHEPLRLRKMEIFSFLYNALFVNIFRSATPASNRARSA